MPCYHPITAWRTKRVCHLKTGKPVIFFNKKHVWRFVSDRRSMKFYRPEKLKLSCGRCVGCRLEKSRQKAVRAVHEAMSFGDNNCFITLTYRPERVPADGSLVKSHWQDFMKRFRKRFVPTAPKGLSQSERKEFFRKNSIRFLMCGEYGENFGRPHFHACIFNFDFPDKKYFATSPSGCPLYRSDILESLWIDPSGCDLPPIKTTHDPEGLNSPQHPKSFGFSSIGEMNFQTAAYVGRYIMKKVTGDNAEGWYNGRTPEFTLASLKPGIGRHFVDGHIESIYPDDFVVIKGGFKCKPPRYYDKVLELYDVELHGKVVDKRKRRAEDNPDNKPDRLIVREKVKRSQIEKLRRKL